MPSSSPSDVLHFAVRLARACLATALAASFLAPAASADEAFTGQGLVQLRPADEAQRGPAGGSDLTTQSEPANGTFYCSVPFAAVQAQPSGFVVGNCPQNTEVRRIRRSGLVDVGGGEFDRYEGGYILGAFSGCGWVRSAQSTASNTTTVWNHCEPNSVGYTMSEFMYDWGGGNYWYDGCGGTASCAGTPINNRYTCYAVANIRPWLSGQSLPPALRYIPENATHNGAPRLAWRYVAKYPTTEGNYWVMARDRAYGSGQGNWVFVPYACL